MKILTFALITLFISGKTHALVACQVWLQSDMQTWETPNPFGGEGNITVSGHYYLPHDTAYRGAYVKGDPKKKKIKTSHRQGTCKNIAKRLRNVYCEKNYRMKRAVGGRADDPSIGSSSKVAKNLKVRSIRWYAHQNVKRNLPFGNLLCAN